MEDKEGMLTSGTRQELAEWTQTDESFDGEKTGSGYEWCLHMPRITHEDLEEAWTRIGRSQEAKDRGERLQLARRHIAYEIHDFCQDSQWDPEAMYDGFSDYAIDEFLEIYPPTHAFFQEALRRQISDRIESTHVELALGKWITETGYRKICDMIKTAVSEEMAENMGSGREDGTSSSRVIKKICEETGEEEEKVSIIYQDVMESTEQGEQGENCDRSEPERTLQWMLRSWPMESAKDAIMSLSDTRREIIFSLCREGRPGREAFRRVAKEHGLSVKHIEDIYNRFIQQLSHPAFPGGRRKTRLKDYLT